MAGSHGLTVGWVWESCVQVETSCHWSDSTVATAYGNAAGGPGSTLPKPGPPTHEPLGAARRAPPAPRRGRAQVDEAALFAAREVNGILVATAARESRRIRRESVRRERHWAEVKPASTAESETPPEPFDASAPTNLTSTFVVEIEPW